MTDSIVVFGRVCPSISRHRPAFLYGDRVLLTVSNSTIPPFNGPCLAYIYAEPQNKDKGDIDAPFRRQVPLAYADGQTFEDAIHALAKRLHELADGLVREPPPL